MGVDLTSEHPESLIRLFLYVRFEGLLAHHVIVCCEEEEKDELTYGDDVNGWKAWLLMEVGVW